jgi:hypothetical protein
LSAQVPRLLKQSKEAHRRAPRGRATQRVLLAGLLTLLNGCGDEQPTVIEGYPRDPYRMSLQLTPSHPIAGEETSLTWTLNNARTGKPVDDLQIVHERIVHNFIVNLDFSSFAHIHHEDFRALTEQDKRSATYSLPYRFPTAGHYRIVSDFTHRGRNWTKNFDVEVTGTPRVSPAPIDLSRERLIDGYRATLQVSPDPIPSEHEVELILNLSQDGVAVTDLGMVLGSEVHVAVWRDDGQYFGHTHSYTAHMAAMMQAIRAQNPDPATHTRLLADVMAQMMSMPSLQEFRGPQIPIHYVFPTAGIYHVFLQCAPGGQARVFHFTLKVEAFHEGMDTRIQSLLDKATPPR